jgi:hypothetical protein
MLNDLILDLHARRIRTDCGWSRTKHELTPDTRPLYAWTRLSGLREVALSSRVECEEQSKTCKRGVEHQGRMEPTETRGQRYGLMGPGGYGSGH